MSTERLSAEWEDVRRGDRKIPPEQLGAQGLLATPKLGGFAPGAGRGYAPPPEPRKIRRALETPLMLALLD
ncbi:MAG: hypothetical protein R2748_22290 [Bryobacterales bacterium]